MAIASASIEVLVTSCIREELPNINLDITDVKSSDLSVGGQGIVKSTIQENGVTLYADMTKADLKNLDLDVSVSSGAKWSFVDVKITKTDYSIEYGGQTYNLTRTDTVVNGDIDAPKDFTETRFIKVVSEREGVQEDDTLTQYLINHQNSGFIGWEKDGKLSKEYSEGAHLYKIWTIDVLPAGIPTQLSFDNWSSVMGSEYQQPYELVTDNTGKEVQSNIWSSTNASIALMAKTMPLVFYGARPTSDVAPVRGADNKSALLLTSNDIRYTKTYARPYLAGCCFIGEYDGSDNGALTCTHVGLPFNKKPLKLNFWYKYLPMEILDPNGKTKAVDATFTVDGIQDYIGKMDKGFIRAVLYRADGDMKWLNGATIRDLTNKDIIAYADFTPEGKVDTYTQVEAEFKYLQDLNTEDLKNWKYNLAIYFASSYDGFRFICGANMYDQLLKLYSGKASIVDLLQEQMGSELFIDEMEIKCE